MTLHKKNIHCNADLVFYDQKNNPINVNLKQLTLIDTYGEVTGCNMTFIVNYDLYQKIDTEELFGLNQKIRSVNFGDGFKPGKDIEIEVELLGEYLPELLGEARSHDELGDYLLSLGQSHSESHLLKTESWRGLYVKQQLDGMPIKTGYMTFWGAEQFPSEVELDFGINNEEFIADAGIEEKKNQALFEVVCDFFDDEGWSYAQVGDEPTLQLYYSGDHQQLACYARVREDFDQFIFYVLCPVNVNDERRLAIAEFITRANYGITIGNFEMDFADGELRFKSSIDVEGDRLTTVLIRNLVYNNLIMMNKYLPGIMAVIDDHVSPLEAIAAL
ncbi:YbjN domain-containing protein [Spirulina sp. CCNP1310]|uniref:YbjN domain-containing protein n=1 Tax=Spirulina sp. CCNP1310 TaxID=3110249 RepID=UPI002B1FA418|nr:YbjN domain-containing protein [Spirulina sp. CCNP1310]MEA5418403.1 YbjN domain-containing protein [Spirulina sp. CCNP1310]